MPAQSSPQTQNFLDTSRKLLKKYKLKFSRTGLFPMKTRVCLINFVHDCLWKQFFASYSPQPPLNLILWTILVTMRLFTQFHFKIAKLQKSCNLSCKKVLNFVLLDNYFTDLFTEVQIQYRKTFKFGPERFLER